MASFHSPLPPTHNQGANALGTEAATEEILDHSRHICWVRWTPSTSVAQSNQPSYYLWPAIYYEDHKDFTAEWASELNDEQKSRLAMTMYNAVLDETPTVFARLLGLSDDTSSQDAEAKKIEYIELKKEGSGSFLGEFLSWASHACESLAYPETFAEHPYLYLPFMKALDEAFGTINLELRDKNRFYQLGKERLGQNIRGPAVDASAVDSRPAEEAEPAHTFASSKVGHDNDDEYPEEKEMSSEKNEAKTPEAAQVSEDESKLRSDDDASRSLAFSPHTNATTPAGKKRPTSDSSVKKLQKKRKLSMVTPEPVVPRRRSTRDRTLSLTKPKKSDSVEEDPFYNFKSLLKVLKGLGWVYRSASHPLQSYVYERVGTPGEKDGNFQEDYFYEEADVIAYCKGNNYKKKYGKLLNKKRKNKSRTSQ